MTCFAACAASGAVVQVGSCLPDDLAHQAPAGGTVVEIAEAQRAAMLASLAGWALVDGELVQAPPAVPLEQTKAAALIAVDRAAEQARLRYITGGAGQALSYIRKEAEARSFVAPGSDAAYPYLAAERDAQNAAGGSATLAEVAAEVLALADAWLVAGAEIERLRRGAKLAIAAAETVAAVTAAVAVTWPHP